MTEKKRKEFEGGLRTLLDHNGIEVEKLDIVIETRKLRRGEPFPMNYKIIDYKCTIVFRMKTFDGKKREALVRYFNHTSENQPPYVYFTIEPYNLKKEKEAVGAKFKIFEEIFREFLV